MSTVEMTADLVVAMLRDQHPDLAELPVVFGANGWDNQLWRLGDDLAVRLPWAAEEASELLLREFALVPRLASNLPLPIPVPQRLGRRRPSEAFPRPWIVTTWVPGEPADRAPVTRGDEAVYALARFLAALHRPAPDGISVGRSGRGGPLTDSAGRFTTALEQAIERDLVDDPDALRAVWEVALGAPTWIGPRSGCTRICTQPISSHRVATSVASSISVTCARAIRPVTLPLAGCCCPRGSWIASSGPTAPLTPQPRSAPGAGQW